jgi:DNA-directed RNA polymerase specialized sigma24 family protein
LLIEGDKLRERIDKCHPALNAETFEQWWPEVHSRVETALRRRGAAQDQAVDAVQEAGARAWAARPEVGSVDELSRWAFTVAWRVHLDERRRDRSDLAAEVRPESTWACADVADRVLGRFDLRRAARAMNLLSQSDRAVLLDQLSQSDPACDRRTAVRVAVRRHRARVRLATAMTKLGAWVAGLRWAKRRWVALLAAPATTIALVLPMAVLPHGSWMGSPDPEKVEVVDAAAAARRAQALEGAVPVVSSTPAPHVNRGGSGSAGAPAAGGSSRRSIVIADPWGQTSITPSENPTHVDPCHHNNAHFSLVLKGLPDPLPPIEAHAVQGGFTTHC